MSTEDSKADLTHHTARLAVFRTTADKLRLSLPLQYVTRTMISPFQALAYVFFFFSFAEPPSAPS